MRVFYRLMGWQQKKLNLCEITIKPTTWSFPQLIDPDIIRTFCIKFEEIDHILL